MTVFKLTLAEVKAKAFDAFVHGTLTAQSPDWEDRKCFNYHMCSDGVERFCAVAAAFPRDLAMNNPTGSITTLWNSHYANGGKRVLDLAVDEHGAIAHIQDMHDTWAGAERAHGRAVATGRTGDVAELRASANEKLANFLKSIARD